MRILNGIVLGALLAGCSESQGASDGTRAPADDAAGDSSHALRVGQRTQAAQAAYPAGVKKALRAGSVRIAELQADRIGDSARNGLTDTDPDDGGWDFTFPLDQASHGTAASPENLYGATALGVYAAVSAGENAARFRTVLLGAGLGSEERPEVDSPTDIVFLPLLGEIADDDGFSELARVRYDARITQFGSAQAIGERTRDARHAGNADGLVMYDLAWWYLAAMALQAAYPGQNYDDDALAFAKVATDDLTSAAPLFDVTNEGENYYVQGLAWAHLLVTKTGAAPQLEDEIRTRLLRLQDDAGAWGWNGTVTAANPQATAHAVQALALVGGGNRARRAASRGASWLISQQAASGGFAYTTAVESALLDGEALLAIYLASRPGNGDDLAPDNAVGVTASALKLANKASLDGPPALSAPPDL
jgi:hypothetical protein